MPQDGPAHRSRLRHLHLGCSLGCIASSPPTPAPPTARSFTSTPALARTSRDGRRWSGGGRVRASVEMLALRHPAERGGQRGRRSAARSGHAPDYGSGVGRGQGGGQRSAERPAVAPRASCVCQSDCSRIRNFQEPRQPCQPPGLWSRSDCGATPRGSLLLACFSGHEEE